MSGRFWIEDEFIDKYAKNLSLKAQAVYICLKRHCNREGHAKIGIRKIAKELGISKNTCQKAIKELQLSQLVGQRINQLSLFGYYTVPPLGTELSHVVVQKELGTIKGIQKPLTDEEKKEGIKILDSMRTRNIPK